MYESTYATSLQSVRDDMAEIRRRILDGSLSPDAGEAVAKAGHVEVKAAEVDLHARVFAAKTSAKQIRQIEGAKAA
jgi:hypothetical protein